jgi:exodeoxyribonuclease-3
MDLGTLMKFATWNCAGGLKRKHQKLLSLAASVMVVQECLQSDVEEFSRTPEWSFSWFGKNPNKGLGVLVKAPWIIREAHALTPKWTGKIVVDGPTSVELFPVWAHKSERPTTEYIEQVHCLLDIMEKTPISALTIVAGDFNSNSMWDGDYKNDHSAAVERFRRLGMESAYHAFRAISQGAERNPTHWNNKMAKDAPYHIDYVFLSYPLLSKLRNVQVGSYDEWRSSSDHAPVLVELDL